MVPFNQLSVGRPIGDHDCGDHDDDHCSCGAELPHVPAGQPVYCPRCKRWRTPHAQAAESEARPFLYHEDEPTFAVLCNVCHEWQRVGVSFFGQLVQCFNCPNKIDSGLPPAPRQLLCSGDSCGFVLTVPARCTGLFQCPNCFAHMDGRYDPTKFCPAEPSYMGPVSHVCENDLSTVYMAWLGAYAHGRCGDCNTDYHYVAETGEMKANPPIPATGQPADAVAIEELKHSVLAVMTGSVPCYKTVEVKTCCPYPWERTHAAEYEHSHNGHLGGHGHGGHSDVASSSSTAKSSSATSASSVVSAFSAASPSSPAWSSSAGPASWAASAASSACPDGDGGGGGCGGAACPVWVNCPPWTKFDLTDLIANCGHSGPLGNLKCRPPEECHTVHFVNTGTGSPFGDEEAALEAAWRMLVEDMGVPPEAIHGCHLKPGTKITYSAKGGPASAEVCCQLDYWCDPTARPPRGNLPPGVHCCCPSRKRQGGCPPPPTPPPGGPSSLPPLRSYAPRKAKKGRCCYGVNPTVAPDIKVPEKLLGQFAPGFEAAGGWSTGLYFTGKVYGDCTDDSG